MAFPIIFLLFPLQRSCYSFGQVLSHYRKMLYPRPEQIICISNSSQVLWRSSWWRMGSSRAGKFRQDLFGHGGARVLPAHCPNYELPLDLPINCREVTHPHSHIQVRNQSIINAGEHFLRSLRTTINLTVPCPPLNLVSEHNIYNSLKFSPRRSNPSSCYSSMLQPHPCSSQPGKEFSSTTCCCHTKGSGRQIPLTPTVSWPVLILFSRLG